MVVATFVTWGAALWVVLLVAIARTLLQMVLEGLKKVIQSCKAGDCDWSEGFNEDWAKQLGIRMLISVAMALVSAGMIVVRPGGWCTADNS